MCHFFAKFGIIKYIYLQLQKLRISKDMGSRFFPYLLQQTNINILTLKSDKHEFYIARNQLEDDM